MKSLVTSNPDPSYLDTIESIDGTLTAEQFERELRTRYNFIEDRQKIPTFGHKIIDRVELSRGLCSIR